MTQVQNRQCAVPIESNALTPPPPPSFPHPPPILPPSSPPPSSPYCTFSNHWHIYNVRTISTVIAELLDISYRSSSFSKMLYRLSMNKSNEMISSNDILCKRLAWVRQNLNFFP